MNARHPQIRIAATADLHCTRGSKGTLQPLFTEASAAADVLCLCGDLTDYGHADEARLLADEIRVYCKIPVIAVLGNHDFESGQADEVIRIIEETGATVLDGESIEFRGIGFAGVCGFGGGFGRSML